MNEQMQLLILSILDTKHNKHTTNNPINIPESNRADSSQMIPGKVKKLNILEKL